ncbi:MAG: hypothetical protein H6608_01025 [Flavobacteriales bacterium]|nr:hypothetical protein [Bacteroidota bacterium]MCB9239689.1 hypothetical protein [Flavobacteriales bacterium]
MIKYLLTVAVLTCGLMAWAQDSTEVKSTKDTSTYTLIQSKAEFPGGESALYAYIMKNVRVPQSALDCGTSGRVVVQFIIEKDGTISNAEVFQSTFDVDGPSKSAQKKRAKNGLPEINCDQSKKDIEEEALRVVRTMPRWSPAVQKSKPVRMRFNLPIIINVS